MSEEQRIPVPGSERPEVRGARLAGPPDPQLPISVTMLLRPRRDWPHDLSWVRRTARLAPAQREYLTRDQLAERHGADADDISGARGFAERHGLTVTGASVSARTVSLSGTVEATQRAFAVDLALYDHPSLGTYRDHGAPITLPLWLATVVQAVFGLDDRPTARPHVRWRERSVDAGDPATRRTTTTRELLRLYDFPADAIGRDQVIGVIELGGGYRRADLEAEPDGLGLNPQRVTDVPVRTARDEPLGAPRPAAEDVQVTLDVAVAAAAAPGAEVAVYFGPARSEEGFLATVLTAIHDGRRRPTALCIGWGMPERDATGQFLTAIDEAFETAAALGITVVAAAGSDGSGDGVGDELAHVDFPASSPHALACGGTTLVASDGQIEGEVVWGDGVRGATGGGVSDVFRLPEWQRRVLPRSANPASTRLDPERPPAAPEAATPAGMVDPEGGRIRRGVPDLAGSADPGGGQALIVGGRRLAVGGTSAVVPIVAGLIARLAEGVGRPLGLVAPLMYDLPPGVGAFREIAVGSNGAYRAGPGWDACSGLGVPVGTGLVDALAASRPAAAEANAEPPDQSTGPAPGAATPSGGKRAARTLPTGGAPAPPGTTRRSGALVLGAHRSGTSACAALIALLGVPMCRADDLYAPLDGNERGHWESASLIAANDRLLARLGRSWWCPPTAQELTDLRDATAGLQRIFRSAHPTSQWVWKDPRLCLTLPVWRATLTEPIAAILVIRHPLEVAGSLEARNGFGRQVALALWERYNRLALRHVAGLPVLVTDFAAVTADPVAWCEEACSFLRGHALEVAGLDAARAATFVERRLHHHRRSEPGLRAADGVSDAQRSLYRLLRESAGPASAFEPPALEPESSEVEECLVEFGRPYGLPEVTPAAGAV